MLLLTKYTVLYKENEICCIILLSLPSRERGLKSFLLTFRAVYPTVAPFAGAWIEILGFDVPTTWLFVAPFAGAWIEISCSHTRMFSFESLPSRERGLKFSKGILMNHKYKSLPSRERGLKLPLSHTFLLLYRRSLRGSVD